MGSKDRKHRWVVDRVQSNIVDGPMAGPFALRASGITRIYGSTVALWGIDLVARAGECLIVRGPNASGKSTLLRVLAGLTAPTRGSVRWIGELTRPTPRVAFVGHQTQLWDALTVLENLTLHARLARVDPAQAVEALGRLGLAGIGPQRAGSLSSGQRRRAAVARAVAFEPDILLLDEPFASLDEEAAELVAQELRRQRERGRLLVLASHELDRSSWVGTRTIWLEGGRLRHDGVDPVLDTGRMHVAGR